MISKLRLLAALAAAASSILAAAPTAEAAPAPDPFFTYTGSVQWSNESGH